MYIEWKKIGFQKSIVHEFGNNKAKRETKKLTAG
jgi:hypothetical protein